MTALCKMCCAGLSIVASLTRDENAAVDDKRREGGTGEIDCL
jgi:hypothetical protein